MILPELGQAIVVVQVVYMINSSVCEITKRHNQSLQLTALAMSINMRLAAKLSLTIIIRCFGQHRAAAEFSRCGCRISPGEPVFQS